MKKCTYCGGVSSDNIQQCPGCGQRDFTVLCNNCGAELHDERFCPNCGTKAGTRAKKCPRCGAEYFSRACPECGYVPGERTQTANSSAPPPQRTVVVEREPEGKKCDKAIALVLCICLGFYGIHKFYEGKIGAGILYLFTFGLCGIGWIIDIIKIASKPNPYYVK